MNDFYHTINHLENRQVLPDDAIICLVPEFYSAARANEVKHYLSQNIDWQEQEYFGRISRRQAAWFADEGVNYRYTGQTLIGAGWDQFVHNIRVDVESTARVSFNSVLLHYYPDGKAAIGWHTDAEPSVGSNPVIASLSFGATRNFQLRHIRTKEVHNFPLEHGMLLIMAGTTQHFYKHCVPRISKAVNERFNLTFRFTLPQQDLRELR